MNILRVMTFLFFSTGAFISLFMTGISILDAKKRRKDNDSDLIAVN